MYQNQLTIFQISFQYPSTSSPPQRTVMPSFQIQNSVAFVTGASKPNGIGRAIVEALLANGASKVYASARHAAQLDDLVKHHKGKVVAVELDIEDLIAIEKLSELYPDVTLVVNNAGYLCTSGDIDGIKTEILVNYIAPLAIGRTFAGVFAKAASMGSDTKPTALVNMLSISSLVNFPFAPTYSASKAAAHSLTQAQRRDLSNTLVIGVCPGPIDTDMTDGIETSKSPTSSVALAIVHALLNGTEDVFPDPMSVQVHSGLQKDFKGVEQQMTA
jgi:NAD(P)-dependent dehydrogenase (short-subunit alcohol dehydrogenase family)